VVPRGDTFASGDGSEELYNHATDPLEHVQSSVEPKFDKIKERFKKHLPTKKTLCTRFDENGGLDSYGKEVENVLRKRRDPGVVGKDRVKRAENIRRVTPACR